MKGLAGEPEFTVHGTDIAEKADVDRKLIILRGNSGSVKSSAARQLQQKFGRGTLIIPQDTVRREMLHARDGADTKALPLLINLLEYGKKNCEVHDPGGNIIRRMVPTAVSESAGGIRPGKHLRVLL